ncbi:MAG: methylenetetrahydrofolate reductase [Candidatus Neomarinimicrobiota bacterium]
MKIIDYLNNSDKTLFSYEIIPPYRGGSIDKVFDLVEQLMPFNPPFIDLTSRSAESYRQDDGDGRLVQRIRRKRPGTIGISAAIKNKFNVETVPHILCNGFTKEETEDALIELNYLGINNILAVRGDKLRKAPLTKRNNHYASDLVKQINDMNSGLYLEPLVDPFKTDFCIGVGGYPEKHFEAIDMKTDLKLLKKKVENGADYIVTQMFYDNEVYFNFVKRCRDEGIDVPIIPGIKILSMESHLKVLPKFFHIDLPSDLINAVQGKSKSEIKNAGIDWTVNQVNELIEAKVPCVHFYIMTSAKAVTQVVSQFI